MPDVVQQPWRDFIVGGRTLALPVDEARVARLWRNNTRYLGVFAGAAVVDVIVLIVLVATGAGRFATYLLLGILLFVLLLNTGSALIMRRRVAKARPIAETFIAVDATGVKVAGVPALAWSEISGVVVADSRGQLASGGGFGGWLRRLSARSGGSLVSVTLGIRDMPAVQAAASGPRAAALDGAAPPFGALTMPLDIALAPEQIDQAREALRAAAEHAGVGRVFTSDAQQVGKAAWAMGKGERLPV